MLSQGTRLILSVYHAENHKNSSLWRVLCGADVQGSVASEDSSLIEAQHSARHREHRHHEHGADQAFPPRQRGARTELTT